MERHTGVRGPRGPPRSADLAAADGGIEAFVDGRLVPAPRADRQSGHEQRQGPRRLRAKVPG